MIPPSRENRVERWSSGSNGLEDVFGVALKRLAGSIDLAAVAWKRAAAMSERKALRNVSPGYDGPAGGL